MIFQEFKKEAPPPITCFEPSRPAYLERSARKKEFRQQTVEKDSNAEIRRIPGVSEKV